MLPRAVGTRAVVVGVVGLCVASVVACGGGGRDGVTAPATITSAVLAEDGTVGASAASQIVVCHKGKDLAVARSAVSAHLEHADKVGSCASVCPCFTREGIDSIAATCPPGGLALACPVQYSLHLYCDAGSVYPLGFFETALGTDSCSMQTRDPVTGQVITTSKAVSAVEYDACRAAIVTSAAYQSTDPNVCPR